MEAMKPRVIISNYAGHNYKGAEHYGELRTMTRGYVSFESLDRLKYDITEFVVKHTHKEDWLLLSGVPVISCIATAVWIRHHGQIKMLVWDKKQRTRYRTVTIDEENYQQMVAEIQAVA